MATSTAAAAASPQFVEVELLRRMSKRRDSEIRKKKVYVTEVNGVMTLDLYSGWALEGEDHKFKLQHLPIKVCSFVNLQKLWVSHNSLSELPGQIDQLVNLRELFLHHNSFTAIPSRLFHLTNLEIVWLSSNQIHEIPPAISSLKNLCHLHLEHNQITSYQEALNDLPRLSVLYLNHNLIPTLSHDIHKLSETLVRLYLQNNKLETIPETICLLEKLEILYLDSNEITAVPQGFDSFCQRIQAENKAVVQVGNNPYVVPRSRVKLSVGGAPPNIQGLHLSVSTRRYSDYAGPRDRANTDGTIRTSRYSVPSSGVDNFNEIETKQKSATLKH